MLTLEEVNAISDRKECTVAKTGKRKICRFMSKERAISLDGMESNKWLVRSTQPEAVRWTFGPGIDNAKDLQARLTDGRPTEDAWAIYRQTRARLSLDEREAAATVRKRRQRVWGEEGSEADGDRWLAGDPAHWSSIRKSGKKPSVTLGTVLDLSCGHGAEDFAANVATMVALADSLIRSGIMVRIVGMYTGWSFLSPRQGGPCDEAAIVHPLLDYGQPVDEPALMAWGTPGASRCLGFVWTQELFQVDNELNGLGSCLKTSPELLKLAGVDLLVAKQWEGGQLDEQSYIAQLYSTAHRLIELGEVGEEAPA